MGGFIQRFLAFDKLMATSLIKFVYWIGLVVICLGTLIGFLGGFAAFGQSFSAGIGALILAPIIGLIVLIMWRFYCELILVMFGIYDRLGEMRDILKGGAPAAAETAPE